MTDGQLVEPLTLAALLGLRDRAPFVVSFAPAPPRSSSSSSSRGDGAAPELFAAFRQRPTSGTRPIVGSAAALLERAELTYARLLEAGDASAAAGSAAGSAASATAAAAADGGGGGGGDGAPVPAERHYMTELRHLELASAFPPLREASGASMSEWAFSTGAALAWGWRRVVDDDDATAGGAGDAGSRRTGFDPAGEHELLLVACTDDDAVAVYSVRPSPSGGLISGPLKQALFGAAAPMAELTQLSGTGGFEEYAFQLGSPTVFLGFCPDASGLLARVSQDNPTQLCLGWDVTATAVQSDAPITSACWTRLPRKDTHHANEDGDDDGTPAAAAAAATAAAAAAAGGDDGEPSGDAVDYVLVYSAANALQFVRRTSTGFANVRFDTDVVLVRAVPTALDEEPRLLVVLEQNGAFVLPVRELLRPAALTSVICSAQRRVEPVVSLLGEDSDFPAACVDAFPHPDGRCVTQVFRNGLVVTSTVPDEGDGAPLSRILRKHPGPAWAGPDADHVQQGLTTDPTGTWIFSQIGAHRHSTPGSLTKRARAAEQQ